MPQIIFKYLSVFIFILANSMSYSDPVKVNIIDYEQIELEIETPDTVTDGTQKRLIQNIKKTLEANLKKIKSFKFVMPTSSFESDGVLIPLSELYIDPDDAEVKTLGGNRLTANQIETIRQDATFVIPSKEYEGMFHMWKVNWLLQKGAKNIKISFHKDMANSLNHLTIALPRALIKGLLGGVINLKNAFKETISQVIGLSFTKPEFTAAQVQSRLKEQQAAEVTKIVKRANNRHETNWDLRATEQKVVEHFNRIEAEVNAKWQNDSKTQIIENRVRTEYINSTLSDADINTKIMIKLSEHKQKVLFAALREDTKLESEFPGVAESLIADFRANKIILEETNKFSVKIIDKLAKYKTKLQSEHPIKSLNAKWLDSKLQAFKKLETEDRSHSFRVNVIKKLQDANYALQAFRFEAEARFIESEAYQIEKAKLSNQSTSTGSEYFHNRIWFSDNWNIDRKVYGDGEVAYYADKRITHKVSSADFMWRLKLFALRTSEIFNNSNFYLLKQLKDGRYGIKSLLFKDPFYSKMKVDQKTGDLVVDTNSKIESMRSIGRKFNKNISLIRENFIKNGGSGFIPFALENLGHSVWYNVIWRTIGNLGIYAGRPIITSANAALTTVASASSPAWSPVIPTVRYAFSNALYDFDARSLNVDESYPEHIVAGTRLRKKTYFLPVVQNLIVNSVIAPVVHLVGGGVLWPAYEIGASAVTGTYGVARKSIRSTWDFIVRNTLLKYLSKTPKANSFFIKRIKGPGLTSEYYYQVSPAVATLAVKAALEESQLSVYKEITEKQIKKPLDDFRKYLKDVLAPFGMFGGLHPELEKDMDSTQRSLMAEFKKLYTAREELYNSLTSPEAKDLVMTKQNSDQLQKTIEDTTLLVTINYTHTVLPLFKDDKSARLKYWLSKELAANDYKGLAKYYLREIFGKQFLTSMEAADKTAIMQVSNPKLDALLEEVLLQSSTVSTKVLGCEKLLNSKS